MNFRSQGKEWDVQWQSDLMDTYGSYGVTDHKNLLVKLDSSVPAAVQKETLLHELIHVVEYDRHLDYNSYKDGEIITQNIAGGLFALFRDNEQLRGFLFNE